MINTELLLKDESSSLQEYVKRVHQEYRIFPSVLNDEGLFQKLFN